MNRLQFVLSYVEVAAPSTSLKKRGAAKHAEEQEKAGVKGGEKKFSETESFALFSFILIISPIRF